MEAGRPTKGQAAQVAATVIDRAMRGDLFAEGVGVKLQ